MTSTEYITMPGGRKLRKDRLEDGVINGEGNWIGGRTQEHNTDDRQKQKEPTAHLINMADVEPETVDWLWSPYIPKGKVTLLEGDPGVGKSWVSLAIATAVSLGKGLPKQEPGGPGNTLLASAEDGLADTIRPRLDAMGADVSRIVAIDDALILDDDGFALLEDYVTKVEPTLLIIDPLVAYLGAAVDIHRANQTRSVMARLAKLAETHGMAILAVRHLAKGSAAKPIYRGLGSIDFTAACRSVLLAGCDPENPQNRGLVQIKSNLAPLGVSIGYELLDDGFFWTGESSLTTGDILATDSGEFTSAIDEAIDFLRDELATGDVLAKEIYRSANSAAISERTLKRAKAKLQVRSHKRDGVWLWSLPTVPTVPTKNLGILGTLEKTEAKKEVVTERLGDIGNDLPDYPIQPCHNCGSGDYWLREASVWGRAEWLCPRCHPKPGGGKGE